MLRKVELTAPLSFLILHELSSPATGTALAKRIGNRRGGILTPGTIYPALQELHRKKLLTYRTQGRKKTYKLTKRGSDELDALYRDFAKMFWGLKNKIKRYNN